MTEAAPPKFTIIIAVYNNQRLTQLCLESIFRNSRDYEVIVIDNGSTDGTNAYLKRLAEAKRIGLLVSEKNLGYLRAQNWALGYARGEYVVPLNNDLEVCAGWLDTLLGPFKTNPKMGIVGLQGSCCQLDQYGNGSYGPRVDYVELSCSMIPRALLRKHGYYSEEYIQGYCEDSDLCLRFRELGYDIAHVRLPIRHKGSQTANLVKRQIDLDGYQLRNKLVFRTRWARYLAKPTFDYQVVIKRQGARGDVLLASSAIRAIKERWGRATIYLDTANPDVFQYDPDVVVCPGGAGLPEHPDYFYDLDLAYERRPRQHIIESYAEVCGVQADFEIYPHTRPEDREYAASLIPATGKWVAISPGPTFGKGRNWELRQWQQVILELRRMSYPIVLIGTSRSAAAGLRPDLDLIGRTTYSQLVAVLERCYGFIGLDGLPMHIAQGSPNLVTVGLFGRVNPAYRLLPDKPWVKGAQVAMDKVACVGCHHLYAPPITDANSCLRPVDICMRELQAAQVMDEFRSAVQAKTISNEMAALGNA